MTGKRSYLVGQSWSREKREPERIVQYSREYEHDLVNREGPGPAAFQPMLPNKAASRVKFNKSMRSLVPTKSGPGPQYYEEQIKATKVKVPSTRIGTAHRTIDVIKFGSKNYELILRGIV